MRSLFRSIALTLIFSLTTVVWTQTARPQYHSFADLTTALKSMQSRYPDIVHLESIGKTLGGREIWVAGLRKGDPHQARAALIVGGVDAIQLSGSELALNAIDYFASSYGKVDSVTRLLDAATIYVIPRLNPDATEAFFAKVRSERRINGTPYDGDRDGTVDEDDVEDLNNDGLITLMRVRDPLGAWMTHPDDPRVMRRANAAADERGTYQVYSEGIDNDADERWNEDPVGGVDMNKNFTFNYEYFGASAGVYPVSETESKAVADFILAHPSISVVFSFSPNDNLMTPWKSEARGASENRMITSVQKEDEDYYQNIGKRFQDLTGLKDGPEPEKGAGAFSEWAYYHAGRWSFSTYPWWAPELPANKDTAASKGTRGTGGNAGAVRPSRGDDKDEASIRQIRTLRWYQAAGVTDVFVPWKAYQHTDFPDKEVEIGGMKPFAMDNPPVDSLTPVSRSFNAFFTDLVSRLPAVSIENVKVEALRSGVYRITADISNRGYFPTASVIGDRVRWVRNVNVVLALSKGQTVSGGKARQVLGPIGGRGAKVPLSWVVVAPSGSSVVLTAESPASGSATQRIDLR